MQPSTPATYQQKSSISQSAAVQEWHILKEMAMMMRKTGFLPKNITEPEQIVFMIMAGKELNMGPMWAIQNLQIVDGKITARAEAMLTLVFKNCPDAGFRYVQNDDKACIVEAKRPGGEWSRFGFSLEDAIKAKLEHKDNWKKYPRAMLRSRAVSEMCRSLFPEAIAGISSYTPEEIIDMRPDYTKSEIQPQIKLATQELTNDQKMLLTCDRLANVNSIRESFMKTFGIEKDILLQFCHISQLEEMTEDHIASLRTLYMDLKDGRINVDDLDALIK